MPHIIKQPVLALCNGEVLPNDNHPARLAAKEEVLNTNWHFWKEGKRGNSKVFVRSDTPAQVRGVEPSLSHRMRLRQNEALK
jgi:hypothetical protein